MSILKKILAQCLKITVEWDFVCDFQTPCFWTKNVVLSQCVDTTKDFVGLVDQSPLRLAFKWVSTA